MGLCATVVSFSPGRVFQLGQIDTAEFRKQRCYLRCTFSLPFCQIGPEGYDLLHIQIKLVKFLEGLDVSHKVYDPNGHLWTKKAKPSDVGLIDVKLRVRHCFFQVIEQRFERRRFVNKPTGHSEIDADTVKFGCQFGGERSCVLITNSVVALAHQPGIVKGAKEDGSESKECSDPALEPIEITKPFRFSGLDLVDSGGSDAGLVRVAVRRQPRLLDDVRRRYWSILRQASRRQSHNQKNSRDRTHRAIMPGAAAVFNGWLSLGSA